MDKSRHAAAQKLYLYLAALFITSLVVSNLIFQKFFYWYPFNWEILGNSLFELSVGILPYPITFLVTDLISEIFEDYKANRDSTPEPIIDSVPIIHEILDALGIKTLELSGYEADDIIGTVAKQAEKEGLISYMVTPDKDFAQLVSENIFLYKPARFGNGIEILGVEEVKNKFEVERPSQVIDFLGMMGDSVDNIPGLPGVGEKTAKKHPKIDFRKDFNCS